MTQPTVPSNTCMLEHLCEICLSMTIVHVSDLLAVV